MLYCEVNSSNLFPVNISSHTVKDTGHLTVVMTTESDELLEQNLIGPHCVSIETMNIYTIFNIQSHK